MKNKYVKWNTAGYYPFCNQISDLSMPSTDVFFDNSTIRINIEYRDNQKELYATKFACECLIRIALSNGVEKRQLMTYLLLQGLEVDINRLNKTLIALFYRGFVRRIKSETETCTHEVYDISSKGIRFLKDLGIMSFYEQNSYSDGCMFQLLREKIVSNQIVLNQLVYQSSVKEFAFNKSVYMIKENISQYPLLIKTESRLYLFTFWTSKQEENKDRCKTDRFWMMTQQIRKKYSCKLVIVAECFSHMKQIIRETLYHNRWSSGVEILYTYDDLWLHNKQGEFFMAMKNTGVNNIFDISLL